MALLHSTQAPMALTVMSVSLLLVPVAHWFHYSGLVVVCDAVVSPVEEMAGTAPKKTPVQETNLSDLDDLQRVYPPPPAVLCASPCMLVIVNWTAPPAHG